MLFSFFFVQALEEAAANAAEEERRRLQTQTELQDRYRMDLEREKMVCHCSSVIRSKQVVGCVMVTTSYFWYNVVFSFLAV